MTGFLTSGPVRGDSEPTLPDPFPGAREIGEIEVRSQLAFNDKLHDPFSATVDLC